MRAILIALACFTCAPAAAQEASSAPELTRATRALAAIWRPVAGELTGAAIERACAGAVEEMAAIEAALPPVLTQESLARVRGLRGLLVVPVEDAPGQAYFFPPHELGWFTSGLGAIAVLSEADGLLALRDAGGRDIAVQLGHAGRQAMLRIRQPEGPVLTFVGCAPVT